MNAMLALEVGTEPQMALYRFYAADGALLYIGITKDFPTRRAAHQAKPWWSEVARTSVQLIDAALAADAEISAIKSEHPRYNKAHNEPRPTRPPSPFSETDDLAVMLAGSMWLVVGVIRQFAAEVGQVAKGEIAANKYEAVALRLDPECHLLPYCPQHPSQSLAHDHGECVLTAQLAPKGKILSGVL